MAIYKKNVCNTIRKWHIDFTVTWLSTFYIYTDTYWKNGNWKKGN